MCNIIQRWWHKRLRKHDIEIMYPALAEKTDSIEKLQLAWKVFKLMPGQEHWRCDCSQEKQNGKNN